MRQRLGLASCAVILLAATGDAGQGPTLRAVMRDKLTTAQTLLGAVVRHDFSQMELFARQLERIPYAEVVSWQAAADRDYVEHAVALLGAARNLREAAAARNGDAAVREYSALVTACTGCHSHVRKMRTISVPIR